MEMDKPGKDSFRHREAGAEEVLLVGGERWALLRETPLGPPTLQSLAQRLAPVDLVLVEGFRTENFPRIEIFRPSLAKPPLWSENPGIVALATDETAAATFPGPVLDLNDPPALASWIVTFRSCRIAGA
jgi:molybdopterin-guanine dinucleotide biosynthesis protein B